MHNMHVQNTVETQVDMLASRFTAGSMMYVLPYLTFPLGSHATMSPVRYMRS